MRRKSTVRKLYVSFIGLLLLTTAGAEVKTYQPKSQIFSIKSEIFGGEFRIVNVIPLHGDFSLYGRLEIVHLKSLIGSAIPDKKLEDYNEKVFKEFQKLGKIKEVVTISDYDPAQSKTAPNPAQNVDSLDAPMLTIDDLHKYDEIRAMKLAGLPVPGETPATLVIAGEVLDYVKGNHFLQFLPFNIGSTIFTIRFRFYDKQTGEEIGRQVITGEVSSDTYAGFAGLHSALSAIAEGLSDQVARRVIESDR